MAPVAVLQRCLADRRGVTAIEYALIATMVAVGLASVLHTFGASLNSLFSSVANAV